MKFKTFKMNLYEMYIVLSPKFRDLISLTGFFARKIKKGHSEGLQKKQMGNGKRKPRQCFLIRDRLLIVQMEVRCLSVC
jgi:hypothetical protein